VTPDPAYRLAWYCSVVGPGGTTFTGNGPTVTAAADDLRRQLDEHVARSLEAYTETLATADAISEAIDG
jgi:hypothetical protein